LGNCTVGMLPLGKLSLGKWPLGKCLWENIYKLKISSLQVTLLAKFTKFNLVINQTNQMSMRIRPEVVGILDCNNQEFN